MCFTPRPLALHAALVAAAFAATIGQLVFPRGLVAAFAVSSW